MNSSIFLHLPRHHRGHFINHLLDALDDGYELLNHSLNSFRHCCCFVDAANINVDSYFNFFSNNRCCCFVTRGSLLIGGVHHIYIFYFCFLLSPLMACYIIIIFDFNFFSFLFFYWRTTTASASGSWTSAHTVGMVGGAGPRLIARS